MLVTFLIQQLRRHAENLYVRLTGAVENIHLKASAVYAAICDCANSAGSVCKALWRYWSRFDGLWFIHVKYESSDANLLQKSNVDREQLLLESPPAIWNVRVKLRSWQLFVTCWWAILFVGLPPILLSAHPLLWEGNYPSLPFPCIPTADVRPLIILLGLFCCLKLGQIIKNSEVPESRKDSKSYERSNWVNLKRWVVATEEVPYANRHVRSALAIALILVAVLTTAVGVWWATKGGVASLNVALKAIANWKTCETDLNQYWGILKAHEWKRYSLVLTYLFAALVTSVIGIKLATWMVKDSDGEAYRDIEAWFQSTVPLLAASGFLMDRSVEKQVRDDDAQHPRTRDLLNWLVCAETIFPTPRLRKKMDLAKPLFFLRFLVVTLMPIWVTLVTLLVTVYVCWMFPEQNRTDKSWGTYLLGPIHKPSLSAATAMWVCMSIAYYARATQALAPITQSNLILPYQNKVLRAYRNYTNLELAVLRATGSSSLSQIATMFVAIVGAVLISWIGVF